MALRYRALLSPADPFDGPAQRALFQLWLDSRGIGLQVPEEPGTVEDVEDPHITVAFARFEDATLEAQRFELSVSSKEHVVKSSLTALSEDGGEVSTLWVEQDHSLFDPVGEHPQSVDVPSLVGRVLDHGDCLVGDLPVLAEPRTVEEGDVDQLIQAVRQPDRALPLVLVRPRQGDPENALALRCDKLQERVAGLASIFIVGHDAACQLNTAVDPDLEVAPGVVRVFMPGVTGTGDNPKRHQAISGYVFARQPGSAAIRLQRPLISESLKRELPDRFTRQVISAPGFPNHVPEGDEELVIEIIQKDTALESLERALAGKSDEAEIAILELDDATRELDDAQARIKYLQGLLREAGDHDAATAPTPMSSFLPSVESCMQAIDLARVHLDNLEIADSDHLVADLDSYPKSAIWGRKAWRALVALNEFAQQKLDGDFDGNFRSFCNENTDGASIPDNWVAMQESESTSNNDTLKKLRTFPIEQDGEEVLVYMCAHIKVQLGGPPAPRIHFYDDCDGQSQKIHIGYFGKHLPL